MTGNNVRRVLDANGNRACEGLRVIEEYFRLFLENASLTEKTACIRHGIAEAAGHIEFITFRDIARDPGRNRSAKNFWKDPEHLVRGNFRRVEEALRVLEEYTKLLDTGDTTSKFQILRFDVYRLEKEWITSRES